MSDVAEPTDLQGPWDYVQGWDVDRFGPEILDKAQRDHWSRALALAGILPYMWRELAHPITSIIYSLLEIRPGDRVLVIGEALEPIGWAPALRELAGPDGEVVTHEIINEARDAGHAGLRGRNGLIGCWRWTYTEGEGDQSFDAVAVLQGAQHCDDWKEVGQEFVRILRPGGRFVSAEAVYQGPPFTSHINSDVHIQAWYHKFQEFIPDYIPYYSGADIATQLAGGLSGLEYLDWRGIELCWGRKPTG